VIPVEPPRGFTHVVRRIEVGVPVFHQDLDEEMIPLESGIEARAISMTKGLLRRAGTAIEHRPDCSPKLLPCRPTGAVPWHCARSRCAVRLFKPE
jgi:hypothetical protein